MKNQHQEELHCAYAAIKGSGTVRAFTAGGLMQMTRHPRDDQNTEYLITRVNHLAVQNGYGSTQGGETGFKYKNDFTVIKSLTPFRTKSKHQAPTITGPQSAHVVGPEGEEIYCDEYGRVKVQFPWDRYGKHNENSSCWIRVSQNWAGGSWGHMAIPRIGHEVLVEFLEGNPDRPVITGRTYHDMNRVPLPMARPMPTSMPICRRMRSRISPCTKMTPCRRCRHRCCFLSARKKPSANGICRRAWAAIGVSCLPRPFHWQPLPRT